MKINANISSLQAYNNILRASARVSASSNRLSSGIRISKSGDDPAGLAISNKIRAQVEGTEEASKNANNGVSLIQTADGALSEVHNMLQRIRELSVAAANDTNGPDDREKMQLEIVQLKQEINDTAIKTEYNQIKVLNGDALSLVIHVGANMDQGIGISIEKLSSVSLGLDTVAPDPVSSINVLTKADATEAIGRADEAISRVSEIRAELGAIQNRFEHTIANLGSTSINASQSLSRIYDTDMAKEMADYSKDNVIYQAGLSILAQANQRPQAVLQLLQ